jgi:hypothetical protein
MDEPKPSKSSYDPRGRIGSDAVPKAIDVHRPADLDDRVVVPTSDQFYSPVDPKRESPVIVYCDNEHEVREGFAIALRAMGIDSNFLLADIVPPAASSNMEDN